MNDNVNWCFTGIEKRLESELMMNCEALFLRWFEFRGSNRLLNFFKKKIYH